MPSADDQVAVQSLLWRAPPPPARGPKRSLTPQQIAATTVRIADADSLEGVSMQRVAAELGVTKMALYRYVSGKAGLMAIAVEEAVGAAPQASVLPSGWRPGLEAWARQLRSIWQAHSWLPGATLGDRSMGPRELAWTECPLGVLAPTGLQAAERLDVVLILSGHVRNTTAAGAAGTQPWTVSGAVGSALHHELLDHGDAFPNLLTDLAEVRAHRGLPDNSWELGLRLLLDGLQTKIDLLFASGDRSHSDPHQVDLPPHGTRWRGALPCRDLLATVANGDVAGWSTGSRRRDRDRARWPGRKCPAATGKPTIPPKQPVDMTSAGGLTVPHPVVHFEVIGKNPDRLRGYFGELFGWQFDTPSPVAAEVSDPDSYGFLDLVATADGTGIRGGVGGGPAFEPHAVFYVGVPDVDAALQRAESLGGTRILGPVTSPNGLVVGHFTDPEGNLLGVAGTG